jgi:hypothetical protein
MFEQTFKNIPEAMEELGDVEKIQNTFIQFQKYLYGKMVV